MSDGQSGGTGEFDRFRDLARKLAQVPKDEIDAEQPKERESREDEHRD